MEREWFSSQKTLKTAGIITLICVSIFLFISTIGAVRSWHVKDGEVTNRPQISVTGTADVNAVANVAQFTYSVIETGKTTKEAQDKATEKANKALAYLKSVNIEDKDIKTIGYNINPQYEYRTKACITDPCTPGTQVLTGYEVSQSIEVKIRNTDQAGTVLSGIGSIGVSNVSGLNLTIDEPETLQREARRKAIEDAEAKAQALAADLNVNLVRVISFQENGMGGPIYYEKAMDARGGVTAQSAPAPTIPLGENTVTSNVTITYEIR